MCYSQVGPLYLGEALSDLNPEEQVGINQSAVGVLFRQREKLGTKSMRLEKLLENEGIIDQRETREMSRGSSWEVLEIR